MSRRLSIILSGLAAFLILVLIVVFVMLLQTVTGGESSEVAQNNTSTPTVEVVAAEPTETLPPTELPEPVVEIVPTDTPLPTDAPTDTPEPTATPEPTETPEPTATPTAVPVIVFPTNTPPPPTSPPPPTAPPVDTHGLIGTFNLQSDSSYTVNGKIWYEFTVTNSTGQEVPYQALGALPKKGGSDRGDWFKMSWGGPNATIKPNGLSAKDWISLPETGNYTLRLAICFDDVNACKSGASPWVSLSQEIPVTIN
ncbi:MAG: hypothetical protein WAM60_10535 [Candidatus Promineifilaceae bacterium]